MLYLVWTELKENIYWLGIFENMFELDDVNVVETSVDLDFGKQLLSSNNPNPENAVPFA